MTQNVTLVNSDSQQNVTLVSSDSQQFVVSQSTAVLSITISNLVDDLSAEKPIPLFNIAGKTLAKIITYLNQHADNNPSEEEKNKFDEEFVSVEMDVLLDLVLAANYLNIKCLMNILTKKIADNIQNKIIEWVRKTFGIANDFTPEEEEKLKQENSWAFEEIDAD